MTGSTKQKKDPRRMTAGEINRELDKLDATARAQCDEFIAAGRGNETANETLSRNDPLALRYRACWERKSALRIEIEMRWGPAAPLRLPLRSGFGPRSTS